jgi:hypothetical protein
MATPGAQPSQIGREDEDRRQWRLSLIIGLILASPIAMVIVGAIFVLIPFGAIIFSLPTAWGIAALIVAIVGRGHLVNDEPLRHPDPIAANPRVGPLLYRPWPVRGGGSAR